MVEIENRMSYEILFNIECIVVQNILGWIK